MVSDTWYLSGIQPCGEGSVRAVRNICGSQRQKRGLKVFGIPCNQILCNDHLRTRELDVVLKVRERRGSGLSKDLLSERHKAKPAHCRLRIQARLRFRKYPEPKEIQQRYGQG